MWSTRDQEAESMDERKESPSRVTAVRVAVLSGKEANRGPRETTGWERRREPAPYSAPFRSLHP